MFGEITLRLSWWSVLKANTAALAIAVISWTCWSCKIPPLEEDLLFRRFFMQLEGEISACWLFCCFLNLNWKSLLWFRLWSCQSALSRSLDWKPWKVKHWVRNEALSSHHGSAVKPESPAAAWTKWRVCLKKFRQKASIKEVLTTDAVCFLLDIFYLLIWWSVLSFSSIKTF